MAETRGLRGEEEGTVVTASLREESEGARGLWYSLSSSVRLRGDLIVLLRGERGDGRDSLKVLTTLPPSSLPFFHPFLLLSLPHPSS